MNRQRRRRGDDGAETTARRRRRDDGAETTARRRGYDGATARQRRRDDVGSGDDDVGTQMTARRQVHGRGLGAPKSVATTMSASMTRRERRRRRRRGGAPELSSLRSSLPDYPILTSILTQILTLFSEEPPQHNKQLTERREEEERGRRGGASRVRNRQTLSLNETHPVLLSGSSPGPGMFVLVRTARGDGWSGSAVAANRLTTTTAMRLGR